LADSLLDAPARNYSSGFDVPDSRWQFFQLTMMDLKSIVALLPGGKVFDPVYASIASCASQIGATALRADTEFSTEDKLGQICSLIEKADLVIADLTARNSHIMYTAGYAHGIGKQILFLTQYGEDFPFDKARHIPIIYAANHDFLRQELRNFLQTGTTSSKPPGSANDAREKFKEIFGDLLKRHSHEHRGDIQMENEKTFVLLDQDMELALVQDLARKARELGLRIKLM
jgi:hypothetical protein